MNLSSLDFIFRPTRLYSFPGGVAIDFVYFDVEDLLDAGILPVLHIRMKRFRS
jgi:hypothetical protein